MIYCQNLVKVFQSTKAVDGINIDISGNGCYGFLGGNGAGKSTTIRMLAGLAKPSSGEIKVAGIDVVREGDKLAQFIGYLPQHPAFFDYMTATEWLYLTGKLFAMSKKEISMRSEQLLKQCDLWESRNRKIGGYSGGMKQRLGIAQALLNRPKVLILDEPVSALDPIGRFEVLQMISQLKEEMTIFMSSHILEDVEKVADHITIIHKGKIVEAMSMNQLKKQYSTPIIHFELLDDVQDLIESLQQQKWVAHVQQIIDKYKVTVHDLDVAKRHLPNIITEYGGIVTQYKIETATLEDIYLRLVSEK